MVPFTLESTSKLRSALHFRYSIVIQCFIPIAVTVCFENLIVNPNNHYNHGFHNTFDYNHITYCDHLLYTVSVSAHFKR